MTTIDPSSIDLFRAHLSSKGRQKATVESYARDSELFLKFLSQAGVSSGDIAPDVLAEFQDHLQSKGSCSNSIRRTVIGVRQFFRFLQDHHQWDRSPLDDAPIPEREESFNHRVSPEFMEQLLDAANASSPQLKAHRDIAMLQLLGFEGLKVHELIYLEWRDFVRAGLGGKLIIRGDRSRTINLEAATAESLSRLRSTVQQMMRANITTLTSKIMLGFKGVGAGLVIPHLTRHGVKFALYELGALARIPQLNSEELRHHAIAHKVAIGFTPDMLMTHLGLKTPGKISGHFHLESKIF